MKVLSLVSCLYFSVAGGGQAVVCVAGQSVPADLSLPGRWRPGGRSPGGNGGRRPEETSFGGRGPEETSSGGSRQEDTPPPLTGPGHPQVCPHHEVQDQEPAPCD